jgi:hypothetical protein
LFDLQFVVLVVQFELYFWELIEYTLPDWSPVVQKAIVITLAPVAGKI